CFFFNDTATTEIYTLSLHDALPISGATPQAERAFRQPSCALDSARTPAAIGDLVCRTSDRRGPAPVSTLASSCRRVPRTNRPGSRPRRAARHQGRYRQRFAQAVDNLWIPCEQVTWPSSRAAAFTTSVTRCASAIT